MGTVKMTLDPDPFGTHNVSLQIDGVPRLRPISVSNLESMLEVSTMPDRTNISSGETKPGTFTVGIMAHHKEEVDALIAMRAAAQGAADGYKVSGTLTERSISTARQRAVSIIGLWCVGFTIPQHQMADEGTPAVWEFEFSYDDLISAAS